jgi:tRNA-2-methylthio-N6-dimethylallyladenosine synthase
MIAGFCSETEKEHQETLSLMEYSQFTMSYTFFYSERPGTLAAKKYEDDIPETVKKKRLDEIISLQREISKKHNEKDIGKIFEVLVEGDSKKSKAMLKGRNSQNKMIVFSKSEHCKPGEYVRVKITNATSATLLGECV